jgi:hypothetical protein
VSVKDLLHPPPQKFKLFKPFNTDSGYRLLE